VLHRISAKRGRWLDWLLRRGPRGLVIQVAERDQAGMRALSQIRERGINSVANALAQSGDHVVGFFELLRAELAFYVASLNLHAALQRGGTPVTFPRPAPAGERTLRFEGLRDVCLSLRLGSGVVGNDLAADGKSLGIVTGANQGGKSTFLRSLGLAQLMMQAGLFVAAASFSADVATGLFTHFRREEDRTMKSGKLDEELARMSAIVDALGPDALVLLNESFSATNEREGSEIATQIVSTLVEKRIKVFFVTHLHAFARSLFEGRRRDAIFLRAERRPDGARTFRIQEGEPLETAFGEDVYREVFSPGAQEEPARPPDASPATLAG
jgi:DNA mismatch repair ATPase MutS